MECKGKGIERGGMRKVKMPIPRVKWFDDLFSMDLISKVVTSGFGDPFMCLLGVQDPLVRIGGGSTLITIDRRICCTGAARFD